MYTLTYLATTASEMLHIYMLIKIGLFWVISCIVIRLLTWFNFLAIYCFPWSWDDAYKRELQTYKDIGDVGEIW